MLCARTAATNRVLQSTLGRKSIATPPVRSIFISRSLYSCRSTPHRRNISNFVRGNTATALEGTTASRAGIAMATFCTSTTDAVISDGMRTPPVVKHNGEEISSEEEESVSSEWSDEDADEYLARALAANSYLQGTQAASHMGVAGSTSASADGEKAAEERGLEKSGTILIHHPACELHDVPGHPERPGRVRAIMNSLLRKFPEIRTLLAPEVKVEQVLRFHTRAHVDGIMRLCERSERWANMEKELQAKREGGGGGAGRQASGIDNGPAGGGIAMIDSDTSITPGSREAIFRAAGAACFAIDEVMSGRAVNAFCCVRPPGHHAEPDKAMGFCFFNNAPIGALHAQAELGAERVAVVDIDVHHGNGTQAFFRKDSTTFYASSHQGPEFYPGTGYDSIKGVARNIVNVSMGPGEGSEPFRKAYSEEILPALEAFRPGVIVISAGFDAHEDDPLASIRLDAEDYRWVTQEICAVADRVCEGRVVSILEGGYNLQAISQSAVAHVEALREASASRTSPPLPPESSSMTTASTTTTTTTMTAIAPSTQPPAEATTAASTPAASTPPPAITATAATITTAPESASTVTTEKISSSESGMQSSQSSSEMETKLSSGAPAAQAVGREIGQEAEESADVVTVDQLAESLAAAVKILF